MATLNTQKVKARAAELGFDMIGITTAAPSPTLDAYERWIAAGMHGSMNYLARPDRAARRRDLTVILPGARSLVMVGVDYAAHAPADLLHDRSRGRIASYAWGIDYHDVIAPRLEALAAWMRVEAGALSHRVYVDTGAILERSHAARAGLGFTGKNTMLINPRRGSTFFIGEIICNLDFDDYDPPFPAATMCGRCTRCLMACPTNAFPRPHVLDARRCISYWTIEHKDAIDPALRPLFGHWIYGCDVCQEVCPFQRFAPPTRESAFAPPNVNHIAPRLVDVLSWDDAAFTAHYAGSPIARIKHDRFIRNACVAAGNSGDRALIDPLARLLDDDSPLVAEHAAWALERL